MANRTYVISDKLAVIALTPHELKAVEVALYIRWKTRGNDEPGGVIVRAIKKVRRALETIPTKK